MNVQSHILVSEFLDKSGGCALSKLPGNVTVSTRDSVCMCVYVQVCTSMVHDGTMTLWYILCNLMERNS